jgi:hypothetical protein
VSARIAQEHGIFKALADGGDKPASAAHLAEATRIKPGILDSLLDYMSTNFMVDEVSPGQYRATKLAQMLQSPLFTDGVTHLYASSVRNPRSQH